MTIIAKIRDAVSEALLSGLRIRALVLSEQQFERALAERDAEGGNHAIDPLGPVPITVMGHDILLSAHCVGPMLVDAAAYDVLQASGLFRSAPEYGIVLGMK